MAVTVRQPGVLATIQDLGRIGAQKYGIVVSGAMDKLSLRIANLLVGNEEGEAAVEITYYGTSFVFENDHLIAITGGDLQPMLDNEAVLMWRPIWVQKGATLTFKGPMKGCLAYVAIAGSFDVPKEIGSKSTYLKAAIGGFKGRNLRKEDVLETGNLNSANQEIVDQVQSRVSLPNWYVNYSTLHSFRKTETIRFIKGSEYDYFTKESQQALNVESYTLTAQADRMGFKFNGPVLKRSNTSELLSEGVTYGTIQVPVNGQPIILMADRQTTGGYPKIGQVISADLAKLSQLQPNSKVHFQMVSLEEAEEALFKLEDKIKEISLGLHLKASTGGFYNENK